MPPPVKESYEGGSESTIWVTRELDRDGPRELEPVARLHIDLQQCRLSITEKQICATHTDLLGGLCLLSRYLSSSAFRSLLQSPRTSLSRFSYHFKAGPERRVATNSTFHLLSDCLPSLLAQIVTFLTNSSTGVPPLPENCNAGDASA